MKTSPIKAILCDIGGVLYVGDTPIEGAVEAVSQIKQHYPIRFLTNTTQKTSAQVVGKLQAMGFDIDASEIITALDVTKSLLQEDKSGAYYLLTDDAAAYFDDLPQTPCKFVVVGDAQQNFSFAHMNRAFRVLMDGGQLLAAAKNRYFKESDDRLSMDAGGFVAALEYASGKQARIIGKPSRDFYHLACKAMEAKPEETLMIGDDIESDILGAQEAGLKAVLVETGKFTPSDLKRGITPDETIASIADLKNIKDLKL
ncbi:MAG: TIGR01458 family HAD-type hydrolase [Sulfurimonadaceae bacterium]